MEVLPIIDNSKEKTEEFYGSNSEVHCSIQKFTYNFDYPSVTDSGSVEVVNDKIILSFPRKPTVTVNEHFKHNQTVQIFVDKQLVFDFNWIPIYTVWDYIRVQDMLLKGLTEYTNIVQGHYYNSNYLNCYPKYCDNIATVYRTKSFYLYCFENEHITSFEIEITKHTILNDKNSAYCHNPCSIQLCFDNNVNFCTETLFKHLDLPSMHFLVQFLLTKITSKINT